MPPPGDRVALWKASFFPPFEHAQFLKRTAMVPRKVTGSLFSFLQAGGFSFPLASIFLSLP